MTTDNIKTFKELTDGIFRKLLGLILIIGGGIFLWEAAFNKGMYKEVVGFIMGSVITIVVNFYYSSSQGSSEKAKTLDRIISTVDEPLAPEGENEDEK